MCILNYLFMVFIELQHFNNINDESHWSLFFLIFNSVCILLYGHIVYFVYSELPYRKQIEFSEEKKVKIDVPYLAYNIKLQTILYYCVLLDV